ncbi:hypothetical protein TTY48_16600 [Tsukamurella sp. TY48]|nr:hypothetical protein TTY48_16600 [Tsukamurella sp. TY48]
MPPAAALRARGDGLGRLRRGPVALRRRGLRALDPGGSRLRSLRTEGLLSARRLRRLLRSRLPGRLRTRRALPVPDGAPGHRRLALGYLGPGERPLVAPGSFVVHAFRLYGQYLRDRVTRMSGFASVRAESCLVRAWNRACAAGDR